MDRVTLVLGDTTEEVAPGQSQPVVAEPLGARAWQVSGRNAVARMCNIPLWCLGKLNLTHIPQSSPTRMRKLLLLEICSDPYVQDASFVPLETALGQADIISSAPAADNIERCAPASRS